ncbi:MAG: thiolase family protein [Phycisphaerales bacterium]|nr:MAG: thiolase family protein [Phycisphaerales bacterium]
MSQPQPVILAAKRLPTGRFFGTLSRVPAPKLGALAIEAVLKEVPAAKDHVDECIMGCVLQGGLGQNPARQAALGAGLPPTLNAHTVNKVCGSGLQAVMIAAQAIKAGDIHLAIAGGFENMTAAPHFFSLRNGVKFGKDDLKDLMQHDGLTCAFEGWAMGNAADHIAQKHGITREAQDEFAARSHQLAAQATEKGWFKAEIYPLTGEQLGNRKQPGPEGGLAIDEGVRGDTTAEGIARLKPAFTSDGTVTAGNASQISDGAAAIIVASQAKADELGVKPLARIVDYCTSGVEPKEIFDAPALGVQMLFDRNGITKDDVDLFEMNEAFAAQCLANNKILQIPAEKINICGGGVALGHPIGASGTRVLTTLIHQLIRTGGKRGITSLCLGGGNAVNMLIETD